jgi:hypothetical protein
MQGSIKALKTRSRQQGSGYYAMWHLASLYCIHLGIHVSGCGSRLNMISRGTPHRHQTATDALNVLGRRRNGFVKLHVQQ